MMANNTIESKKVGISSV